MGGIASGSPLVNAGMLSRQARNLTYEVAAWLEKRNIIHAVAEWHFTTDDARIRLKDHRHLLCYTPAKR